LNEHIDLETQETDDGVVRTADDRFGKPTRERTADAGLADRCFRGCELEFLHAKQ
jgi:hypothetical protein